MRTSSGLNSRGIGDVFRPGASQVRREDSLRVYVDAHAAAPMARTYHDAVFYARRWSWKRGLRCPQHPYNDVEMPSAGKPLSRA
jgi:hypothetical protein